MPTVGQLTDRYANFLLPVLSPGSGVCEDCGTFVVGGWPRCYQCKQAQDGLAAVANIVDFVALAVKGEQLAYELRRYKSQPGQAQREIALRLAALLWRWISVHEECMLRSSGCDDFPIVTTVPTGAGRSGEHPLEHMVRAVIPATTDRFRPLLRAKPGGPTGRVFDADRWIADKLEGEHVLLVDDTWTSGSHAQSAVAALKTAGAGVVGVLCIGRHFQPRPPDERYQVAAEEYRRAAKEQGWDWGSCRLCSGAA